MCRHVAGFIIYTSSFLACINETNLTLIMARIILKLIYTYNIYMEYYFFINSYKKLEKCANLALLAYSRIRSMNCVPRRMPYFTK